MILLDTNVLSDSFTRSYPKLDAWLAAQALQHLYISSISLAEIAYGIHRLPAGNRQKALLEDLATIRSRFQGRILAVSADIALVYGAFHAEQMSKGFNDSAFDSLLIATAKKHELVIATRNLKHFRARHIRVVNPYE